MSLLWAVSRRDRDRLRESLRALGPSSVPALAAALAWRESKVVRVAEAMARTPGSALVMDPTLGRIRIAGAPPPGHPPAPPSPPEPGAGPGPELAPAPTPPAAPPLPTPKWAGRAVCPTCAKPMSLTASSDSLVCASCGRITRLSGAQPLPPRISGIPASAPTSRASGPDLRSQEMIAAYVSARPIPCPKCKTQLRHRGFAEYGCPACGASVRFSDLRPGSPAAPASEALTVKVRPALSASPPRL